MGSEKRKCGFSTGPLPPGSQPRFPVHLDPAHGFGRKPFQQLLSQPRPPGPTFRREALPLQQLFHQPLDLFQLRVFPFHLEDCQILIGTSVTEPGDPDPDSVLRILLLEGETHRETQSRAVTPGLGAVLLTSP